MIVAAHQTMLAPQGAPLPYDAEVEYVQTDGYAYVDTGVFLASSAEISAIFSNCLVAQGSQFFGARTAYAVDMFGAQWSGRGLLNFNFGSRQDSTSASFDNSPQILTVRNNVLTLGSFSVTSRPSAFTTTFPAYILCMNDGGSATVRYAGLRCHGFRIEQSGTLVRDYIPVRVGSVGYLYDRASGTLYGNAGTGAFTIGPDK